MITKELTENNYMEALLRASLLLADSQRIVPVHEILISGFQIHDQVRRLYPHCRIIVQSDTNVYPATTVIPPPPGEDYLILYPIRKSH